MIEIHVRGMTCGHCENAVRQEFARIDDVQDLTIELVPDGISIIRCASGAPLSVLHGAIEEAGYDIVD
jgi:copper chaperone